MSKAQQKQVVTYYTLRVTVLKAQNTRSEDYWSESDCYVTLHLPTASARVQRTKALPDTNNPVWNETFNYTIIDKLKNVLEIKLFDEDAVTADNLLSTLMFDICSLTPGRKETKVFITNPERKDELWLEFELLKSESPTQQYVTNGILMGAPLSALDVNVKNLQKTKKEMVLKIRGAYQENIKIDNSQQSGNLRFFVNRDLETEIGVEVETADQVDVAYPTEAVLTSAVPIQPLPVKQEVKVSLPIGKDIVDVKLKSNECVTKDHCVRLDSDIPPQEKEFLMKRKPLVAKALHKALNLKSPLDPNKVPTIALVASGGGSRAMTGLLGSLKGLQQSGLLDLVTYITGVSGSTWAMCSLYQQADWSQRDIADVISAVEAEITKSFMSSFSVEKLSSYKKEMEKREAEGHLVSVIDMWGLVIEHLVFGKKKTSTLSEQQKAVAEGKNPLPIYTAINIKDGLSDGSAEAEWCEFTPYEVGVSKYGAFVTAEDFGSEFYLGQLIKKLPEVRLPFLIGIWSSAMSFSLSQLWKYATGFLPGWMNTQGDDDKTSAESRAEKTAVAMQPITSGAQMLNDFLSARPIHAQTYNFFRGFCLHESYNENHKFNAWKELEPGTFPNQLTPTDPLLKLVDAAHSIGIACEPVLRVQRSADIIITLSYSWDPQDVLQVIKDTSNYCTDHKIPFPSIDFKKLAAEPVRELYVFEDSKNPSAPVVLHLPLVNVSYKKFKAPGVPRSGEQEMKAGQVDVKSNWSPYSTTNLTYSKKDYQALVDITYYNLVNNKKEILEAIGRVVKKNN